MGLGTRELLLIIRGQDELSRTLRGLSGTFVTTSAAAQQAAARQMALGGAISTVGVGMAAVGAIGAKWLDDAVDSAKTFQTQVALVKTQVDNVNVSQQQLENVSKTVAKSIAAPLDQLNASLYDIFSSMDVNVAQSQKFLEAFAQAAVAGQVDVQTAGRATIAIMNAWHLPVSDLSHIMDVQFQLVRKGVGTYQEFADVIGQAIPSAQRAGQSIDTLAGMMAYLTRNGLSAAMAAASSQRALDAFSNPKVVGRLKAMGVAVLNNKGGFNDFSVVIEQLQKKLSKMTDPQRSAALQQLFLGAGGTIQARRFYDTVLESSTAVKQYTTLVGDMKNSSGALAGAYDTMSNTMTAKTQLLSNEYGLLKISVGEALIPVLTKLVPLIQKIFDWWNSLSTSTQHLIIYIAAIASILFIVGGAILFVVGTFIMMAGAAAMADIALAPLFLTIGAIVIGIAALAVAAYLVYKNWDTISKAVKSVWVPMVHLFGQVWSDLLNKVLKPVLQFLQDQIGSRLGRLWRQMSEDVSTAMNTVKGTITDGWNKVASFVKEMLGNMEAWYKDHFGAIQDTIKIFKDWFAAIWPYLRGIISNILYIIVSIFENTWGMIAGIVKGAWEIIVGIVKGGWEIISSVFRGAIDIIEGIVGLFIDLFTGRWSKLWDDIMKIVTGAWEIIRGVFAGSWIIIEGVATGAWHIIAAIFTGLWKDVVAVFKGGVGIVGNIWDTAMGTIEKVWQNLWNNGILGFLRAIGKSFKTAVQNTVDQVSAVWSAVKKAFADPVNWVIALVWNTGIVTLWNGLMSSLGIHGLLLSDIPLINTHAAGGLIEGPGTGTSDSILSWLSNKEYVVNAKQTAAWLPLLQAINGGMMPGFAAGGMVSTSPNAAVAKVLQFASVTPQQQQILSNPYGTVTSRSSASDWNSGGGFLGLNAVDRTATWLANKIADALSNVAGDVFHSMTNPKNLSSLVLKEVAYAQSLFPNYGWTIDQIKPLISLWQQESGWNPDAVNKSSGAYGIPQSLGHGHPYNLGDYASQIRWGENYINQRYGSPAAAWAHEVAHNWYDIGLTAGFVPKGTSMMMNGTGADEHLAVLTNTQWAVLHRLGSPSAMLGGNGGGNTYNITVEGINIYTNEIDPSQHAVELGNYLTQMGAGALG